MPSGSDGRWVVVVGGTSGWCGLSPSPVVRRLAACGVTTRALAGRHAHHQSDDEADRARLAALTAQRIAQQSRSRPGLPDRPGRSARDRHPGSERPTRTWSRRRRSSSRSGPERRSRRRSFARACGSARWATSPSRSSASWSPAATRRAGSRTRSPGACAPPAILIEPRGDGHGRSSIAATSSRWSAACSGPVCIR